MSAPISSSALAPVVVRDLSVAFGRRTVLDGIDLVVHFDPPTEPKAYLHRSGRTARAGAAGTVVTLALPEQAGEVAKLHRRAQVTTSPYPTAA